ncbi:hypothetical protein [Microbacterium indicum]|uniref:hypothetical protein n=1 Tax=Microbacterium indicum TaxID=358100 RepID=UPI000401F3CE|nr:hypothetical protein [Microbacterium indicum]
MHRELEDLRAPVGSPPAAPAAPRPAPLAAHLRAHDGAVPIARLRAEGRDDELRAAIGAGHVVVLRRRWAVLPEAPLAVFEAIRQDGRITCVTALERLGVAVPHSVAPHIATRRGDTDRSVAHWHRPVVPPEAGALVDPVENALDAAALCLPAPVDRAVWQHALDRGLLDAARIPELRWSNDASRALARAFAPAARRAA